jgi:hypothetical protein
MSINLPDHICGNAAAGLIHTNIDENNMPEVLVSGNAKTNYNYRNFDKNGWYVRKLKAAEDHLVVDELQQEMSIIFFKSRKVWNQVFNNNTST